MVTLRANHNSESMSGTVMVDALVAVVIASLMVAIVVVSLRHSQSLLKASQTARQAAITMKALLVTAPNYAGDYKGQADGFAYQMQIEPMEDQNTPLCRVKIELLAPKQTKPYRLTSQKWCQVKPQ